MTLFPRGTRWVAAVSLLGLVPGMLLACGGDEGGDVGGGAIEVSNARAQFTTTDVGAVYFDIRSTGAGDRLVGAAAEIADDTQVHEVVSEGGSSMMRPVGGRYPRRPWGARQSRAGRLPRDGAGCC